MCNHSASYIHSCAEIVMHRCGFNRSGDWAWLPEAQRSVLMYLLSIQSKRSNRNVCAGVMMHCFATSLCTRHKEHPCSFGYTRCMYMFKNFMYLCPCVYGSYQPPGLQYVRGDILVILGSSCYYEEIRGISCRRLNWMKQILREKHNNHTSRMSRM